MVCPINQTVNGGITLASPVFQIPLVLELTVTTIDDDRNAGSQGYEGKNGEEEEKGYDDVKTDGTTWVVFRLGIEDETVSQFRYQGGIPCLFRSLNL